MTLPERARGARARSRASARSTSMSSSSCRKARLFGHEFAKHMKAANLDPAAIPTLEAKIARRIRVRALLRGRTTCGTCSPASAPTRRASSGSKHVLSRSRRARARFVGDDLVGGVPRAALEGRLVGRSRGAALPDRARLRDGQARAAALRAFAGTSSGGMPLVELRQRFGIDIDTATRAPFRERSLTFCALGRVNDHAHALRDFRRDLHFHANPSDGTSTAPIIVRDAVPRRCTPDVPPRAPRSTPASARRRRKTRRARTARARRS